MRRPVTLSRYASTNLAAGISKHELSHAEVKETAAAVETRFTGLLTELTGELG